MQTKYYKAGAAVEAVFLIPMICFIIITILLVTLYIHDRAVLQSTVCEMTVVGENYITDKEGKQQAEQLRDSMLSHSLMGSTQLQHNSKIKLKQATASYSASYPFPGFSSTYLPSGYGRIQVSWKHKRINPVEGIRLYRGLSKTVSGLKETLSDGKKE